MSDVSEAILAVQLLLAGVVGWVARKMIDMGKETHQLKGEVGKLKQSLYGPEGNPEIGVVGLLLELKAAVQDLHDAVVRRNGGGDDGRDRRA